MKSVALLPAEDLLYCADSGRLWRKPQAQFRRARWNSAVVGQGAPAHRLQYGYGRGRDLIRERWPQMPGVGRPAKRPAGGCWRRQRQSARFTLLISFSHSGHGDASPARLSAVAGDFRPVTCFAGRHLATSDLMRVDIVVLGTRSFLLGWRRK